MVAVNGKKEFAEEKMINRYHKSVAHTLKSATLAVSILVLLVSASHGAMIPKLKSSRFWPGHWPKTVMVTGNYAKPRLLAEMAQRETNLPVILVSQEEMGDEIYYLPPPPNVRKIQPKKFAELIDVFLRPKRVIFIGDETYVPTSYQKDIQDKYPTIIVSGDDWIENARELGKLIGVGGLHKKYRKTLIKLLEAESHSVDLPGEIGEMDEEPVMPDIEDFEE